MEVLRRIVYLVFRPDAEWALIASEPTTVDVLLRRYILPLSGLTPIATFIGMVVQKLRTPGAQVAAAVAGILAALLAALPYKVGLTIATLVAIAVAVMVERHMEAQRPRGSRT